MKRKLFPSEKILQSRIWKWLTIIATILGILAASTALIDWWGDHFIYNKFFSNELVIEQRLSPEMMKKLKEGEEIKIEKGIRIKPESEPNGTN
jgi:hypothetical protein